MTGLRIGSLFSGYAGLDLAVTDALGGTVAWHCENDKDASAILTHHWPDVPNLGDVTAVEWPRAEPVDVLTGGFPCQDVSHAGRRAGMRPGTRSGLWTHMAYAINVLRPRLVVAENVRGLLSARADSNVEPCPWCVGDGNDSHLRALGAVLGDLAVLGYDAAWCGVRAADVGAPHGRFRVFVVAADTGSEVVRLRPGLRPHEAGWVGRGRLDDHGAPEAAADADGAGPPHGLPGRREAPEQGGHGSAERRGPVVAADTAGDGRHQGRPESARQQWGPDAAERGGGPAAVPGWEGSDAVVWGPYEPAVRRWEQLTRPAPSPTEAGARGGRRLNPAFVEWMMGLPPGHVTSVPISRNAQLKALGNGVVPQQAALALHWLLMEGGPLS